MAQRRGPDGTVRVAISGTLNGEPWANVFWCLLTGGTTATQAGLDAWNAAFLSNYQVNWKASFTAVNTIAQAQSTLFQPGETALHSISTTPQVGTGTFTVINDNAVCSVISWLTNVYWRGGKPRTYIPQVGTADTTDGKTLTAQNASSRQIQANTFHTGINGLSATGITQTQHGFVSFSSGGVPRNPSVFFPISGAAVHKRLGTQRSRLGSWVP